MFRTAAHLSSSVARAFVSDLHANSSITIDPSLWNASKMSRGLALAISGGVDSMALAYLCKEQAPAQIARNLIALVVDHQLREESGEEAQKTKEVLEEQLGIKAHILRADELDQPLVSKASNLETVARDIRYRLLGKACRDRHIENLFFAHHGDDVYETAILRMSAGSTYRLGLDPTPASDIPANFGIYGVHRSGHPVDFGNRSDTPSCKGTRGFEGGGVKISRPLLRYPKATLVELCQNRSIPWVEDPSNEDVQLTARNAIRHSFQDELVPKALSRSSIDNLVVKVDESYSRYKALAAEVFGQCQIRFDPAAGTLYLRAPFYLEDFKRMADVENPLLLAAFLVQLVMNIVSADEHIPLAMAKKLAELLFPLRQQSVRKPRLSTEEKHNIGHVLVKRLHPASWVRRRWSLEGRLRSAEMVSGLKHFKAEERGEFSGKGTLFSYWSISRSPPERIRRNQPEHFHLRHILPPETSNCREPYFYDQRFWIGVENPSPYPLEIRSFKIEDWTDFLRLCESKSISFLFSPPDGSEPLVFTAEETIKPEQDYSHILHALNHYGISANQKLQTRHIKNMTTPGLKKRGFLGLDLASLCDTVVPVLAIPQDVKDCGLEPGSILAFPTLGIRVLRKLLKPEEKNVPYQISWRRWIGRLRWTVRYKEVDWGTHEARNEKVFISGIAAQRWKDIEQMNLDI